MPESATHMNYVRKIVSYMTTAIESCQEGMIMADLAEYGKRPPKVIGGVFPDVYYRTPDTFVIGEAKTDDDIERSHTDEQLNNYIKELRTADGHKKHLILATSVYSFAMWKNKIVRLKRNGEYDDIKIHIIDNLSKKAVL